MVVHVVDNMVVVFVISISSDMSAVMSGHSSMSSVVMTSVATSLEAMEVAMVAVQIRDYARIMAMLLGPFARYVARKGTLH
jgi:hypothetical protein